jgi:hypothetical protein
VLAEVYYDLFDISELSMDYDAYVEFGEVHGQGYDYMPYTYNPTVQEALTVRLRSALACGDVDVGGFAEAYGLSSAESGKAYFSFAAVPPPVQIYDFLTDYALVDADEEWTIDLVDCVPGGDQVRLTSPGSWLLINGGATADVVLPSSVTLTYRGTVLDPGESVSGVITVTSMTAAFPDYTIPVGARRLGYDLSLYSPVGLNGDDDAARPVPLPFAFPVAGTFTDTVMVSTNGAMFFGPVTGAGYDDDYNAPRMSFDTLDPYHWGAPILAVAWGDRGIYDWGTSTWPRDVYFREVTGPNPHVEILWWTSNWYTGYAETSVFEVDLFPDGHVDVSFPHYRPLGAEVFATFTPMGVMSNWHDVWSIVDGTLISLPSIPGD